MNELQEWQAVLAAAQAQGRQDLVTRAQQEIARLQAVATPGAPESVPGAGQAFVEGAVGAVKAPFQAAAGVMKADLGELPGMAAGMAQGVAQGIPELLRRALGPGAEETRDPAMFMGKGGMRATMPPSVSGPERAGALGTLSVAALAPSALRGTGSALDALAGAGGTSGSALRAFEAGVAPGRAANRARLEATRKLTPLREQKLQLEIERLKRNLGIGDPRAALEGALRKAGAPEADIARKIALNFPETAAPADATAMAIPRGQLNQIAPQEPPSAVPVGAPLPTFGNLAVKPGSVVEEVVSDIQRRGPVAASEILKRGAGANPATQPPNTLLGMLNEAGGNPFAPTAAEAGQPSALAAMRQAAQEAARGAYNLVLEATGNPEAAKAAARRAAGMIQGAYERGTGGL